MFQLRITVIHALGRFSGCLAVDPKEATEANIKDLSDGLQQDINRLRSLVLVRDDGTDMAFNEKILGESVLLFKIEEVE